MAKSDKNENTRHRKRWRRLLREGTCRWGIDLGAPLPFDEEPFETDQDLIVFSQPFRRLKDKTQVYPLAENDHVRTRLSHSLEAGVVGQALARGVGIRVGLSQVESLRLGAIVKSACLAHDIGHPPLGHMGEKAIGEWFRFAGNRFLDPTDPREAAALHDLSAFEGNAHAFRIVNQLENFRGGGGLRLTSATLAAMMKYPWGSTHKNAQAKRKFGFFATEQPYAKEVAELLDMVPDGDGWHRHPLAHLVEAADDICYRLIDAEDGIEVGDYTFDEYVQVLAGFLRAAGVLGDTLPDFYGDLPVPYQIVFLRANAMHVLGKHTIDTFLHKEDALWSGTFTTGKSPYGELLKAAPAGNRRRTEAVHTLLDQLEAIPRHRMYNGARKLHIEAAYHKVINLLLSTFVAARLAPQASLRHEHLLHIVGLRPKGGIKAPAKGQERAEAVRDMVDFVAGMTDRYALGLFRQIEGISHATSSPMPLGASTPGAGSQG
jgi:dGTPase